MKQIAPYILIAILLIVLFKTCNTPEPKPEIITKIKTVHDTVIKTKISTPKTVYVPKVYNDTIIVNNKPKIVYIKDSIRANEYDTKIESNNAFAKLKITTTGELLDVKGIITYPEKETTIKTPVNKSYLYIYGQSDVELQQFGVGLDYTIKNKAIIGVNVLSDKTINLKFGVRF